MAVIPMATPADCRIHTCRNIRRDGTCACGHELRAPDACDTFKPEHWVRIARRDDGSLYCSRTEFREYLDETLAWHKRQRDAREHLARLEAINGR